MIARVLALGLIAASLTPAQNPVEKLWNDLAAKRNKLSAWHQEFEFTEIRDNPAYKSANGFNPFYWNHSYVGRIILDASKERWRQKLVTGSDTVTRIFEGTQLFTLEDGTAEFIHLKNPTDGDANLPPPYRSDWNWPKAAEIERHPCGIPGQNHQCVVLDVPIKPVRHAGPPSVEMRISRRSQRMVLDLETGLMLSASQVEMVFSDSTGYQSATTYLARRFSVGIPPSDGLFTLPSTSSHEVKAFSPWNAARINKHFAGNPAPKLQLKDLQGKPIPLAFGTGKTILLNFWITWSKPCIDDSPALEELHEKYGSRNLQIVSIAVFEERSVVDKLVQRHHLTYPIALASENDLPRPYQIAGSPTWMLLPTYIVINKDGVLESAAQGLQGLGGLRKLLEKAGFDTR